MSGTANSFSMIDPSRKRKYEEGNGEHADCDSDSDSDMACIAPDSDDDSPNVSHVVEKHVPVTGPSIKQDRVCIGATSSANRSTVTASLPSATKPSATKPSFTCWATKYLVPPEESQISTTTDQTMFPWIAARPVLPCLPRLSPALVQQQHMQFVQGVMPMVYGCGSSTPPKNDCAAVAIPSIMKVLPTVASSRSNSVVDSEETPAGQAPYFKTEFDLPGAKQPPLTYHDAIKVIIKEEEPEAVCSTGAEDDKSALVDAKQENAKELWLKRDCQYSAAPLQSAFPVSASSVPSQSAEAVLPPGRSWTWRYFRVPTGLTASEATSVICELCDAVVKRGHPGKTAMGTSALASHLGHRHKITKSSVDKVTTADVAKPGHTGKTAMGTSVFASHFNHRHKITKSSVDKVTTADVAKTASCSAIQPRSLLETTHSSRSAQGKIPPPAERLPFLSLCVQSCQYCGDVLACGESLVATVVKAARNHAQIYHPKEYELMLEQEMGGFAS